MNFDFLVMALAALIPLVVGAIWYNPKVLGTAWMHSTGLSEEQLRGANMPLIFGLCYLFSLFLAMFLNNIVIHQFGAFSTLMGEVNAQDPTSVAGMYLSDFLSRYGGNFRTFKHGAFHGVLTSIFMVLPVVGTLALFERKSFKYIAIHVGYWAVSFALMGGIICQFAKCY